VLAQLYPASTAADDDSGWQPTWDARAHERTLAPLLSGCVRVRVRVRVTARVRARVRARAWARARVSYS